MRDLGWGLVQVGARAAAEVLAQTSVEDGAHGVTNTWLESWRTRSWGSGGHGGCSSAALGIKGQKSGDQKVWEEVRLLWQ